MGPWSKVAPVLLWGSGRGPPLAHSKKQQSPASLSSLGGTWNSQVPKLSPLEMAFDQTLTSHSSQAGSDRFCVVAHTLPCGSLHYSFVLIGFFSRERSHFLPCFFFRLQGQAGAGLFCSGRLRLTLPVEASSGAGW